MPANWKLFKKWEIEEKRSRLKNLPAPKAFKIFEELYSLQEALPSDELEKTHRQRVDNLTNWRKKMDSLKERLG